jgi:hypothetical protein
MKHQEGQLINYQPGHPIPNDITNPDANLIYVYDGIL